MAIRPVDRFQATIQKAADMLHLAQEKLGGVSIPAKSISADSISIEQSRAICAEIHNGKAQEGDRIYDFRKGIGDVLVERLAVLDAERIDGDPAY